jgi:hypothetical protein
MPNIRSGLIEDLNGRNVILEEDGLFWAAEIRDIATIPTSERCADVASGLVQFQQASGVGASK